MMRHWREREFARKPEPAGLPLRPAAVGLAGAPAGALSRARRSRQPGARLGGGDTRPVSRLPLAGGWTPVRDMPAPEGRSFHSLWAERQRDGGRQVSGARATNPRRHPRRVGRGAVRCRLKRRRSAERVAAHRRNLIPARAAALDHRRRDRPVRRDGRGGADDRHPGRLAGGGSPRWHAISPRKTFRPSCHGARPEPRRDPLGGKAAAADPARAGRSRMTRSLTPCLAAIAETGTLMLISGPHTPTTLNFLPDTHIVVVRADRSSPATRMAGTGCGPGAAKRDWPRTVNFITGPSRTGDIEQHIELGAHGPRRLHVVLVDGAGGRPEDDAAVLRRYRPVAAGDAGRNPVARPARVSLRTFLPGLDRGREGGAVNAGASEALREDGPIASKPLSTEPGIPAPLPRRRSTPSPVSTAPAPSG